MKKKWFFKKIKRAYKFYENCSQNQPNIDNLVFVQKTIKQISKNYKKFDENELMENVKKIEAVLDENDRMLEELTDFVETKFISVLK